LYLTCKERYPINTNKLDVCSSLATRKNEPVTLLPKKQEDEPPFNLFFSVNPSIFEQFYLIFGSTLPFNLSNGLLKVYIADDEN
jgi:hypothetical protein